MKYFLSRQRLCLLPVRAYLLLTWFDQNKNKIILDFILKV